MRMENPRGICTVCEQCNQEIYITGDGNHCTRRDKYGGHYFCTENCAEKWESKNEQQLSFTFMKQT